MQIYGRVLASIRVILLKFHYYNNGYNAYKSFELGCNGALYMENKVTSEKYLGFNSKNFPETPHLSLQLYCLATMSVWLASAIKERHIFYVTYIHERGTELRCYSFLFISTRLQACCVIHFYFCSFSIHV